MNLNAGSPISPSEAREMIERFKTERPSGLDSYYFGNEIIKKVLDSPGASGIRIHNGVNGSGEQVMILEPLNATEGEATTWGEFGQACPPFCEDN